MIGKMRCALGLVMLAVACGDGPGVAVDGGDHDGQGDGSAQIYPVTGKYVIRNVTNDPAHNPNIPEVPVRSLVVTVKLADGASSPVDAHPDGTFSFRRSAPDQTYRLTVVADS